jgi:hypothetical protein
MTIEKWIPVDAGSVCPYDGIVINLLGKDGWNAERANSTLLLQQPIIARPGLYRHMVEVDIRLLSFALQKSQLDGLAVEHICGS